MARRFPKDMRPALVSGARIEWRNGSHWHPGEVTGPIETDSLGDQCVPIVHRGRRTKTVDPGQALYGYPKFIRLLSE